MLHLFICFAFPWCPCSAKICFACNLEVLVFRFYEVSSLIVIFNIWEALNKRLQICNLVSGEQFNCPFWEKEKIELWKFLPSLLSCISSFSKWIWTGRMSHHWRVSKLIVTVKSFNLEKSPWHALEQRYLIHKINTQIYCYCFLFNI